MTMHDPQPSYRSLHPPGQRDQQGRPKLGARAPISGPCSHSCCTGLTVPTHLTGLSWAFPSPRRNSGCVRIPGQSRDTFSDLCPVLKSLHHVGTFIALTYPKFLRLASREQEDAKSHDPNGDRTPAWESWLEAIYRPESLRLLPKNLKRQGWASLSPVDFRVGKKRPSGRTKTSPGLPCVPRHSLVMGSEAAPSPLWIQRKRIQGSQPKHTPGLG